MEYLAQRFAQLAEEFDDLTRWAKSELTAEQFTAFEAASADTRRALRHLLQLAHGSVVPVPPALEAASLPSDGLGAGSCASATLQAAALTPSQAAEILERLDQIVSRSEHWIARGLADDCSERALAFKRGVGQFWGNVFADLQRPLWLKYPALAS